ncbi:hypothetical protein ACWEKR_16240 [Nocardia sp. NPDC004573]
MSEPGSGRLGRTVGRKFFGTLKYEHLFRGVIADGDALDVEVHRFRVTSNTIRPHQAIDDRVSSMAFTDRDQGKAFDKRLLNTGART